MLRSAVICDALLEKPLSNTTATMPVLLGGQVGMISNKLELKAELCFYRVRNYC